MEHWTYAAPRGVIPIVTPIAGCAPTTLTSARSWAADTPEAATAAPDAPVLGKRWNCGDPRVRQTSTQYMVAYHQPSRHGYPVALYPQSEVGSVADKHGMGSPPPSARLQRRPSEAPLSPTMRRVSSRHLGERSEYMVSYSHTPQRSSASVVSSVSPKERKMIEPPSPVSPIRKKSMLGTYSNDAPSLTRATSTSSVELILSSCEPSLLHITPVLADLGIHRLEHLRALGRLSEETRDREIKEQALKRGVTMVEWAILLDRLHSL